MVVLLSCVAIVLGLLFTVWIVLAQPTTARNSRSTRKVDARQLRRHVEMLSGTLAPRDYMSTSNLDLCAAYILEEFRRAGASSATYQDYTVSGSTYRNVVGRFGPASGSRVVVGAHYDACGGTPGADDNASGVAGLIALAHLLGANAPSGAVELVAFTLEEPPFFRTDMMGSFVHAASLRKDGVQVRAMIALEMIGYFSNDAGSQHFPFPLLRLYYPSRGNFISVIGRLDQRAITKRVKVLMRGTTDLGVHSMNAPSVLPGIDLSDHRSYWRHGMPAVMITDTAFYRNHNYHGDNDTPDRLDYSRMADVVVAVYETVSALSSGNNLP